MADESEMVERVARALAALSLNLNGNDAPIPHEPIIDRRWQNFVPQAHAAISAMREPTEAMLKAGVVFYHDNYREAHIAEDTSIPLIWRDMIDAALNKGAHD